MADVTLEMVAKVEQALAGYEKISAANKKLQAENKRLRDESRQGAEEHRQSITGQLEGLAKTAAGYMSISAAINVVNRELERKKQLEDAALTTQQRVAKAQRDAAMNLPPGVTPLQLEQRVSSISKDTGTSPTQLYGALSKMIPSARGFTPEQQDAFMRQATRVTKGDSLPAVAEGLVDYAEARGITDPKQALGGLARVAGRGQVGLSDALSAFVPAIGETARYGTGTEAESLVAALSTQFEGTRGAQMTRNLSSDLAQRLRKAVPKAGTLSEAIAVMRANPAKAKRFVKDGGFNAKETPVVQSLFGGDVGKAFDSNMMEFATPASGDDFAAGLLGPQIQRNDEAAINVAAGRERAESRFIGRGRASTAPEALSQFQDITGEGDLARMWSTLDYKLTPGSGVDYLMPQVERAIGWRQQKADAGDETAMLQIELLRDLVQQLKDIKHNQKGPTPINAHEE